MTIAAAYLTSDGVVFGADSTATYTGAVGPQLANHTQKVFEIGEGTQFGFCVCGDGGIGPVTHRTVSALLGDWVQSQSNVTVLRLANRLLELCRELTLSSDGETIVHRVGYVSYFLGGIDPGRVPKLMQVQYAARIDRDPATGVETRVQIEKATEFTIKAAYFDGQPDFWHRTFFGFAQNLPQVLLGQLKAALLEPGDDPSPLEMVFATAWNASVRQFCSNAFNDIPLRDAIDYIHSSIFATIKGFKFKQGTPACGGPIEVAYVSTDRKFRWARHKAFDSAVSENETHNDDR